MDYGEISSAPYAVSPTAGVRGYAGAALGDTRDVEADPDGSRSRNAHFQASPV